MDHKKAKGKVIIVTYSVLINAFTIGVETGGGATAPQYSWSFIYYLARTTHARDLREPYTCGDGLSDETGQRHTNISPKPWL